MDIAIKSIADLENILGKKLARELCAKVSDPNRGRDVQRKPKYVDFHETKPPYYLNDGDTLTFYGVDLVEQKITSEHFGGSSDTAIHHGAAQFSSGQETDRDAVLAVTLYWNGKNMSWHLDIISRNIRKQLSVKSGAA